MEKRQLIPQEEIDQLVDEIILPFYGLKRDMTVPAENFRDENDAEHSWSVALIACALAPEIDPALDIGKICQFSVVHDMIEIYAGDTSVWAADEKLADKEQREAAALKIIKSKYSAFSWLIETIEEYERMDTQEALYVRAIDKFVAVMIRLRDNGKFYVDNKITQDKYEKNMEASRRKAHGHEAVGQYYERIRDIFDNHPEYFYQDGNS
jgi:5'-deoxynucleotidase YfbR-like HD superfamily hydrolase